MAGAVRHRHVSLERAGGLGVPAPGRHSSPGVGPWLERERHPSNDRGAAERLSRDAAMSDFLTTLAARTIAAPSLRPRTRMRFEPAADEPPPAIAPDVAPLREASAAIEVPVGSP